MHTLTRRNGVKMNFNVTNVIMFMAGILLVYSGVKGVIPKDVIMAAFEGKAVTPNKAPSPATPNPPNPETPTIYPSV